MTTNQNEDASVSQQVEHVEQEIAELRAEQASLQAKVKELLRSEDPANGITYHEEIFRMQQDKLRMDTEIQFLQVKLRRLQATW